MRTACLRHAIELALAEVGPIAKVVAKSQEVGVIVPSILTKNLEDAGYDISYRVGPGDLADLGDAKHGAWVLVELDGVVVARAYSHDEADALLQAVYGAMKEEEIAAAAA